MALVDLHYAYITLIDSREKKATVEFRVGSTDANAYYGALTQILKDATEVGQLLLSIEDLSNANMVSKGVKLLTVDDAYVVPDVEDHIYNFDKIGVSYKSGIAPASQFTIPARNNDNITVADDGVTIITEGDGADDQVVDFIARYQSVVLHPTLGSACTILGMEVVS